MLFFTQKFICFFIIVFTLHWSLSAGKSRHLLLLLSSYTFYAFWSVELLSLIFISSFVDFIIAKRLYKNNKRYLLIISLMVNLGVLSFFKYFNFFISSFNELFVIAGRSDYKFNLINIILPLGISFYTFQSMSYTIDIYRKKYRPYKNFYDFALYVSFFPQLIAGPIVRADYFYKQLKRKARLSFSLINTGLRFFIIGCFKKICLADQASVFANEIFSNPQEYSSFITIIGVISFSFQIYFDFSGYSDMARGLGYFLGYKLPINFLNPYFSNGIRDFWRRWHLSLSSWLKDYLYIPLGGSRKGDFRTKLNLIITMLLGGLWHGPSWNFVIWGGIHGVLLSIEDFLFNKKSLKSESIFIASTIKLITFIFVSFSWIFFRSESFDKAILVLQSMFTPFETVWYSQIKYFGINNWVFGMLFPVIWLLSSNSGFLRKKILNNENYLAAVSLLLLLITLVVGGGANEFIYFQF